MRVWRMRLFSGSGRGWPGTKEVCSSDGWKQGSEAYERWCIGLSCVGAADGPARGPTGSVKRVAYG